MTNTDILTPDFKDLYQVFIRDITDANSSKFNQHGKFSINEIRENINRIKITLEDVFNGESKADKLKYTLLNAAIISHDELINTLFLAIAYFPIEPSDIKDVLIGYSDILTEIKSFNKSYR